MSTSTANISFRTDLLEQIDRVATEESRSRSELIREAARLYIERLEIKMARKITAKEVKGSGCREELSCG